MRKPSRNSIIAVIVIIATILIAGWIEVQPANAVSLKEQRRQRELAAQQRHEITLAKIEAKALVEAAKHTRNYY